MFHQRLGRKLSRADRTQVEPEMRRRNLDENLIQLLMLVGLAVLLGLIKLRVIEASVEVCESKGTQQTALSAN